MSRPIRPARAQPPIKAPQADDSTVEYWDGARRGELRLRYCLDCAKHFYYPRPFCPVCWSTNLEWRTAAGTGTVYTYSIVHSNDNPQFRERLPYVVAIVELDEGPRVDTNLVDCDHESIVVGMRVEVIFEDEGEVTLPRFRPQNP